MESKMKSRKFIVWTVWAILSLTSIIVTKTISPEIISWFGAISAIYIGGNVANYFIYNRKN